MRTDMLLWIVQKAIDTTVEKILPRGSCSHERWLTLDLEAVAVDGRTFRYLAQYRAMSNYIDWRTVIPGEAHIRLADNTSWNRPRAPWVPLATLRTGKYLTGLSRKEAKAIAQELGVEWGSVGRLRGALRDVPHRSRGQEEVAPGFVIAFGCHDSCWREHGMDMRGLPRVDTGRTWTDDHGREHKVMEDTTYFRWVEAETVRVHSVKLEGATGGGLWDDDPSQWDALTEGEWVNPDPESLTGAWAIYTALGALYACGGHSEPLELDLDTSYEYYRPYDPERDGDEADDNRNKLMRTQQRRVHVGYRLGPDGRVTHTGEDTVETGPSRYAWTEIEARYLDRAWHLRQCGASQKKIREGLVGISHLWDW